MNNPEAIGVVETLFYTTALELTDLMCKTAPVELLGMEKDLGGRLVTVIVGGSVSSVSAAVEAARSHCAGRPGNPLKMALAIARPHPEILKFILPGEPPENQPPPGESGASGPSPTPEPAKKKSRGKRKSTDKEADWQ
jgi:microcompartment protein CcmL/EutN